MSVVLESDVVEHHAHGDVRSYAIFDPSRRYRYALCRSWDNERPRVCFVMLNPSTLKRTIPRWLAASISRGRGVTVLWSS